MQRDYAAAAWTWNTTGLAAGTYQIGAWARQAGSPNSYDAYAITTFALGVAGCTSAGLAPSVGPPQSPGAVITLTASSTGCASPQYQFWVLPPGGSWTVGQAYGAGTTWQLDTSRYGAGMYQVGVWTRAAGSPNSYDAFFVSSYPITTSVGCVVAALNANASPPQPVGTSVTFTPQQTTCGKQYKFWLLPPGGSWSVVQAYGAGSTWAWNTASWRAGVYEVGVWEGAASSPSSYESYAITTFTLGVSTCISAAMTPNPPPPQVAGTMITFSASSMRCASPQYEFWLLTVSGGWTIQQTYGAGTWSWNTSGLRPGTYQVGVWARQVGSTASYDAYYIGTYKID